jgi:hypothetical protein
MTTNAIPSRQPPACEHARRGYFRVVIADGRTQATERCLTCWRNPRPQAWVARRELPCRVEELPLLPPPPSAQLLLFPGL